MTTATLINDLSTEQLEQLLTERKKAETEARQKAKQAYETKRNAVVEKFINRAKVLETQLTDFKTDVANMMDEAKEILEAYGGINGKSKGGFSVFHGDGHMRIVRTRDISPVWDERAEKGTALIKEFLFDAVKKRDVKMFEILLGFLERNDKGDMEYSRVYHLMKHEDKFTDERWTTGLQMLKESYTVSLRGYGYEFKTKNADGKWQNIALNFSSI